MKASIRAVGAFIMRKIMSDKHWNKGFPNRKGWYQCRIDGIEIRLYFFICELNPKKRYWVDETQAQISDEVEWLETN